MSEQQRDWAEERAERMLDAIDPDHDNRWIDTAIIAAALREAEARGARREWAEWYACACDACHAAREARLIGGAGDALQGLLEAAEARGAERERQRLLDDPDAAREEDLRRWLEESAR